MRVSKFVLAGLWLVAGGALIVAGVMFVLIRTDIRLEQIQNPITEEDIERNRVRITTAVLQSGVPYKSALEGFWYMDAQGNLLQYNPDAYARNGISDTALSKLVEDVTYGSAYTKETTRAIPAGSLSKEFQFHNALYAPGGVGNTYALIERLALRAKNGNATREELEQLAYAYEQIGSYKDRDAVRTVLCKRFDAFCAPIATITIAGFVVDLAGNAIEGATVEVLGHTNEETVTTNSKGAYTVRAPVAELEKIRIKATKRNFSDGIGHVQVVTSGRSTYEVLPIVLSSAVGIVSINTKEKTVTGADNEVLADGSYRIITPQSEYRIPADAIVTKEGAPYEGLVDVYLYEFTKDTVPESLVAVDTFDQVMGYAGDLMKTFGMPYIQFFTPGGKELHVRSSNPMVLTYRIYHMQALYNAEDNVYPPLTEEDMAFLEDASVEGSYDIDRDFLIRTDLLRFPAFWVFDQARGVWDNVGVDVVDKSGVIRSIFYTIRG